MYVQTFDPMNNMVLSGLLAVVPIIFFFLTLVVFKIKGYVAGLWTVVVAIVIAVAAYGMPLPMAVVSAIHGGVYGLFPIGWIVIGAVFLYNITVETGQFEIIKKSIASITNDRRLQVLLISFSFGAFLEGAAGFGTPVAITAAMLIGLGFKARNAACLCLLANTAPVAFGGLGIPVLVAAQVTGIDGNAIAKMLAYVLPILGIIIPFYLVLVMSGVKGCLELLPAILVCGISFSSVMFVTCYYLGPVLPDITASLASIVCLVLFLKVWQPSHVWRYADDAPITEEKEVLTVHQIIRAWSPFIVLIILVADWGVKAVQALLNAVTITIPVPIINKAIESGLTHQPLTQLFAFNWMSAAGTSIVITAIVSIFLLGMPIARGGALFLETLNNLKFSLLTISAVLAYAYVGNNSGMTTTMGYAVAATGSLFPLFSAIVGWLGVFVTGSDTSANALFGKLQTTAFERIGSFPILGIGANLAGGGVGKMISPQSIAIAAAATGLVGKEGELYKFSMKHSVILLALICVYIYMMAGPLAHFVPHDVGGVTTTAAVVASTLYGQGLEFIIGTLILLGIFGKAIQLKK
jgi:lactate permease